MMMRNMLFSCLLFLILSNPCYLRAQQELNRYDVIITEVLPDPAPRVLLPEEEYIEILNVSDQPVNLEGWYILVNDKQGSIDSGCVAPGEYVLLTHANNTKEFTRYGKVIGINKMPALLNSGATLVLKNAENKTIHAMSYSDDYYTEEYKSEGGWSLELADITSACIQDDNWKVSEHYMGGTPGLENSVSGQADIIPPPEILNIGLQPDNSLTVYFNQPMDSADIASLSAYEIEGCNDAALKIEAVSPFFNELCITPSIPFAENQVYTLTLNDPLKNCAGTGLYDLPTYTFAIPEEPMEKDIIISEVLFDPVMEEAEFIEIFNRSEKYFLANALWIFKSDKEDLKPEDSVIMCNKPFIIKPGDAYVITSDRETLCDLYHCENPSRILENNLFFALNNSGKCLTLKDTCQNIIDHICYSPEDHHRLLRNTEGISLERLYLNEIDGDWNSTSGIAGNATPGILTSEILTGTETGIDISPLLVTPEGNGNDDVLTICFHHMKPGYVATVKILDVNGSVVQVVIQNVLVSEGDCVMWEGRGQNNSIVVPGLYIVFVQIFHPDGDVKIFKEGFAVNSMQ